MDTRKFITGFTPEDLTGADALAFEQVRELVRFILRRVKYVVGHAVAHDLAALNLAHDELPGKIVDTHVQFGGKSLKRTVAQMLGFSVQRGAHCCISDALYTMGILRHVMRGDPDRPLVEMATCSACGYEFPSSSFSGKQMRQRADRRKCRECVFFADPYSPSAVESFLRG